MISLLGGTSDARHLAAQLHGVGHDVLVSTASVYGARLAAPSGADVRGGPLDEKELDRLVSGADAVVDATHPFAERISGAAAAACARIGRPYLRVERPAGELPGEVVRAADAAEAARIAAELAGVSGGFVLDRRAPSATRRCCATSSELAPLRAAGVSVVRPAAVRSGLLRGAVTDEDRAAAAKAWAAAVEALSDPACYLVVLDELHAALRHGFVELDEVLAALAARPAHQEVVTSGRGAPADLLEAAALVTEMTLVRHPYPDIPARRGVEL